MSQKLEDNHLAQSRFQRPNFYYIVYDILLNYKCLLENMNLDMKRLIKSQQGCLDKFLTKNKQKITEKLDENLTNE
jgi:hypothetical protein